MAARPLSLSGALISLLLFAPPASAQRLAVETESGRVTWWDVTAAPTQWHAALPVVSDAVVWQAAGLGLEVGELTLAGAGATDRVKLLLARIDPALHRLSLDYAVRAGGLRAAWGVDRSPSDVVLAVNAGQFTGATPWGWWIMDGRELQPPGVGPLSMALVVDTAGAVRFVAADDIAIVRRAGGLSLAFQSYPVLLAGNGEIPEPLRAAGRGVDVTHRDTRLAVGELRDGRLLFVLTRYAGLRGVLSDLPIGPTTPEMAAVMGALGCRQAVMLDGGLSGQMLVRATGGRTHEWTAWRNVPLGLLARPRSPGP